MANKVKDNLYVDNYLDSFATESEAVKVSKQLTDMLQRGGFRLNQWSSSSRKVLATISSNERQDPSLNIDLDDLPIDRTQGLHWNCESDRFCFDFKRIEGADTKRKILAAVMSMFDPLGFLSPVILGPKILLQEIWRIGLDWDETIPPDTIRPWKEWTNELEALGRLSIPRSYSRSPGDNLSLHIFSDASEVGYGAVAYLRFKEGDQFKTAFVVSKSLVTPNRRSRTIPELELQSAVIGFRLSKLIGIELRLPISSVTFWTDSQVVLLWLNSRTCRLKTFVANRVGELLDESELQQWRHVPGTMNPADDCSRGLLPSQLTEDHHWFNGPEFLKLPEQFWPCGDTFMKFMLQRCQPINHIGQLTN